MLTGKVRDRRVRKGFPRNLIEHVRPRQTYRILSEILSADSWNEQLHERNRGLLSVDLIAGLIF